MDIQHYKDQSIALQEGIIATDIADTDEIVSSIIDQKQLDSIAYQVCEVQTIGGPTGAHFSLQWDTTDVDPTKHKSVLVRTDIVVEDDTNISTSITQEALQDMQAQFGKSANNFISKTFAGLSAKAENVKLNTKMKAWAVDDGALTLTTSISAESKVFEISQKVAENVLKINSKNYITLDAFAILPQSAAAAFLALGSYFADAKNENGLFIGKTGRINYYVNPDPTETDAIIGLNGRTPGSSSVIFSPYQYTIVPAINADNGEKTFNNINRYAITLNSLSTTGNEMLRKFTIA